MAILALFASYLAATTYPFRWMTNDAQISGGVATFQQAGILYWNGIEPWKEVFDAASGVLISVEAQPYMANQTGPARILTISRDHSHANFTMGQQGTDLVVRLRRSADTPLGVPPYVIPDVFRERTPQAIEVIIRDDAISISVNGNVKLSQPLLESPFGYWDAEYRLALGNEFTWERPWSGEISAARLETTSTKIDVLRQSGLSRLPLSELIAAKFTWIADDPVDLLLNFVAMIPLGILTVICLPRSVMLFTVMWALACVGAETAQVFIYGRHPCMSDFALNMLGIILGMQLLARLPKLRTIFANQSARNG